MRYVPSVAKVFVASYFFLNIHYLGTERDTLNENEMNSTDICSIYLLECFFFLLHLFPISSKRGLKHLEGNNTFATDSIVGPRV